MRGNRIQTQPGGDEQSGLVLIQGAVEDFMNDEFGQQSTIRMKGTDGKLYKVVAGPELSDIETISGKLAVILGLIEEDLENRLTITAVGYRVLPPPDKIDTSII